MHMRVCTYVHACTHVHVYYIDLCVHAHTSLWKQRLSVAFWSSAIVDLQAWAELLGRKKPITNELHSLTWQ